MGATLKYLLPESEIPTHWVNLLADLGPPPHPPLHPGTKEPLGPEDLAPIFPMGLIEQEVSTEPEIEIPDEVREIYKLWRPTPLHRAHRLERALDTPAHIYYKYEGGLARRLAQAEHRRRAGLLQQARGRAQAGHRDRRRPVGLGAGVWPAGCSTWSARCSWSGSATTRSPTAGR